MMMALGLYRHEDTFVGHKRNAKDQKSAKHKKLKAASNRHMLPLPVDSFAQ